MTEPIWKNRRNAAAVLPAAFFAVDAAVRALPDAGLWLRILAGAAALAAAYLIMLRADRADRREQICGWVFGGVFALAVVLGREVWGDSDISSLFASIPVLLGNLLGGFGIAAVTGCGAALIFHWTAEREQRLPPVRRWPVFGCRAAPWIMGAFLLLCWLPWYLALYPGVFSYDIQLQAWQVTHRHYSMGMSPTHTFCWELCIRLGGRTGIEPIVIYSLTQMVLLAAMMAEALRRLIRNGVSNGVILAGLLFLGLNPVVAIMSFSTTRDVLFAGLFVLMTMDLADMLREPDTFFRRPVRILLFILGTFLMVTLRSNGMYAMWLGIPGALLMRKYRLRAAALMLVPMFLLDGLTLVYRHYGFEEGDGCDTICIPVQQVATVWNRHRDELSAEEQETILAYLDENKLGDWNPRLTDPVKSGLDTKYYLAHTDAFWKLWMDLFRRYPADYWSAFLTLNVTSWYPGADSYDPVLMSHYADVLEAYPGLSTYISIHRLFRPDGGYSFEGSSKLPLLEKLCYKVSDDSLFRPVPVVNALTATWFPLWAAFLIMMLLISRGRWRQLMLILPCAGLWATCVLGPGIHFRYVLPIYLLYPVFLALLLQSSRLLGGTEKAAKE